MAEENFVHKTLDKLLDVIEVELKLPLGIAEVKMSPTAIAKEWRENQKKRNELENAIQHAEEKFTTDHKDQKIAQMLLEFSLYAEDEFKDVVAELLTHLSEDKILWLAEVKLKTTWGNVASTEDIRKTLGLYIPYLRHELNSIKEFREVISALTLERIDETTRRIESKLDRALESHEPKNKEAEPDFWFIPHPYPMPPNFTGRAAEQTMLDNWLMNDKDRLFILRALGGFGKSALTWQWINTHVNPAQWTKLVWWSFYEGDASFENFITETLKYLKLEVPQGQRPQVDELLKAMQSQKILLVMDGFERVLRLYGNMNAAYQNEEDQIIEEDQLACKDIYAEFFLKGICSLPNIKSKVLMTTRLTPRAIKLRGEFMSGCHEEELTAMQKADAVEFFCKQKIKGTHAEIEAACAPYGYHPLSLRILAGLIIDDREIPGDVAVAKNLDITDDIIQNKHHVLEVAYNTLASEQQKLLSNIACFRFSIEYAALKTISGIASRKRKKAKSNSIENLGGRLKTLEARGLLQWNRRANKYDLHPIVRRYAYERLTISDRITTHTRLMDYFETVPKLAKVERQEDLAPIIELYHHTVRAGNYDKSSKLFWDQIKVPLYYQFGAYQTFIELLQALFINGEEAPPHLKNIRSQSIIIDALAGAYAMSGQPKRAIQLALTSNKINEKESDKQSLAIGLENLSTQQLCVGNLQSAKSNLLQSMELSRKLPTEQVSANIHGELGRISIYLGEWQEAEQEILVYYDMSEKHEALQMQEVASGYRAHCFLMIARANPQSKTSSLESAIRFALHALELSDKTSRTRFPFPVDYMRAFWLLGTAYRENKDFNKAQENLAKAIDTCRQTNNVMFEADILLDLARLRYDQKNYEEAKNMAEEALTITERCGYVLQGADVNLFLAQYALEQDKAKAKQYAEEAKKLATCDGPPYYYKVAYEEAERFLENLK